MERGFSSSRPVDYPDSRIAGVVPQGSRADSLDVYPTGGKQAIDWAKLILTKHVTPPLWVELPFQTISPQNAQDVCNQFKCPDAKGGSAAATAAATASK